MHTLYMLNLLLQYKSCEPVSSASLLSIVYLSFFSVKGT